MLASDVVVCVPWIDTGCVWRERSRERTAAHWENLGVPVVYGISHAEPICRAQARNAAAALVEADVLFFADADMWVEADQFHEAIAAARTGVMALAYTDHLRLTRWSTQRIYEGAPVFQGQSVRGCSSGCFAISSRLYRDIGGHDERFRGWGGEDRAFMFACHALAGVQRIEGTSFHLWHPRGRDQARTPPERRAGLELALRYKRAAGVKTRSGILPATKNAECDSDAMRALLQEPGGPLAPHLDSARG